MVKNQKIFQVNFPSVTTETSFTGAEDSVAHYNLEESRIAILKEFYLGIHKFECTYIFHIFSID